MALREPENPTPAEKAREPEVTSAGPRELETGGVLAIDRGAVQSSYRAVRGRASPAESAAVVKADAYGCGLAPVVRALEQSGCKVYFVAHLAEGRQVRAIAPDADIYALNGLAPGSAALFADANVRPVIGSLPELTEWDAFCPPNGWRGGGPRDFATG